LSDEHLDCKYIHKNILDNSISIALEFTGSCQMLADKSESTIE
jgi:hypothetical protein